MAIPWQADFFQCTAQFINFTDPKKNKSEGIPLPPTYNAFWWPPQSPMFVMTTIMDTAVQRLAGVPSGLQVYYLRGINSFAEMVTAWAYLGFVSNRNTAADRAYYPSFEEVERNHDRFIASSVAVGTVDNFVQNTDSYFAPMWFLRTQSPDGVLTGSDADRAAIGLLHAAGPGAEEDIPKRVFANGVGRRRQSTR
jgi:L-lysine 6-oxidase